MENEGNRYKVVNITKPANQADNLDIQADNLDIQADNLNSQAEVLKKILLKSAVLVLAVAASSLYNSASEVSQIEPLFATLMGGSAISIMLATEAVEAIIKGISKKIVGEATSELKAQIAESEAQITELKAQIAKLEKEKEEEKGSRSKGRR